MGTHPIFESDFDCLTEKKKMWRRTALVSLISWSVAANLVVPMSIKNSETEGMRPAVAFEPNAWCNKHHYTWFDGSTRKRTCQEYGIKELCNEDGTVGRRWKNKNNFHDFENFGFSALNCPQCGCLPIGQGETARNYNESCDRFNLWYKFNQFGQQNEYVGTYRRLPNST